MKPLVVLLIGFLVSLLGIYFFHSELNYALAGRIGMSAMLLFTAMGHFMFTKGMTMMLPAFVPLKKELVYLTGVIEIVAAIGLLLPDFQHLTAWLLILFFILLLPANIYAATQHLDYQKATKDGPDLNYLWFRVPLQVVFIAWVYFSSLG